MVPGSNLVFIQEKNSFVSKILTMVLRELYYHGAWLIEMRFREQKSNVSDDIIHIYVLFYSFIILVASMESL